MSRPTSGARNSRKTGDHLACSGPLEECPRSLSISKYRASTPASFIHSIAARVFINVSAVVNVFDTAINYRCQRSERAVGLAIVEAIASGEVRRDEMVVCTKGGYVARSVTVNNANG